ncbi:MAG: hypothetical protein AB7F86_10160 [Bdellovibrionales bacterium]
MNRTFVDYASLINECDEQIRSGSARAVAAKLMRLNLQQVPQNYRLAVSNICRRVGLVTQGLRLLSPIVRPSNRRRMFEPASQAEQAEYSVLLLRRGITGEASEILARIDTNAVPEALLFKAFCSFKRWDYAGAVPHLEKYVRSDISNYSRMVGRVNLAAALIGASEYQKAKEILANLDELVQEQPFGRLHGNCLELRAQVEIIQDRFDDGLKYLTEAEDLLQGMPTMDRFFVTKWRLIANGLKTRTVEPFHELRQLATEKGDWETAREADRFLLRVRNDQEIFEHLVFGTPFEAYRQKVLEGGSLSLVHDTYLWGQDSDVKLNFVDLSANRIEKILDWGKCLELLEVLSRDFYAPRSLGALFSELWPGEYFDVFSSPMRLHQIVYRTRGLLKELNAPYLIEESSGQYRLRMMEGGGVLVPLERRSLAGYRFDFERLANVIPLGQAFKARQARQVLNMPRVTFQRFSKWAEEHDLIIREGNGPSTVYKIKS